MNADGSIIKCHLVIEYCLEHVAESNQSWDWMYRSIRWQRTRGVLLHFVELDQNWIELETNRYLLITVTLKHL